MLVSTGRMQGVQVDPVTRNARVEAGVRWRSGHRRGRPVRAGAAVRVVVGRGRRRLHPRRRDGPPRPPSRLRRRPRARGRARDGRRASCDGHGRERPRAVLGAAWRSGQLRDRHRARVRPGSGARVLRRRAVLHRAGVEHVLHAFAAWAPTLPEEVTTSVALLRLPPVDRCRRRCAGWSAWRCGSASPGSRRRGDALLAPMRAVADAGARLGRPDAVRRGGPHPHGPDRADAGGDARRPADSMPGELVDAAPRGGRPGRRGAAADGRAPPDGRRARPPRRRCRTRSRDATVRSR